MISNESELDVDKEIFLPPVLVFDFIPGDFNDVSVFRAYQENTII